MDKLKTALPFTLSTNGEKIIVKIQRSIFPIDSCLIYDREESFIIERHVDLELQAMMEDADKRYFEAIIDSHGVLQIGRQVKNQEW